MLCSVMSARCCAFVSARRTQRPARQLDLANPAALKELPNYTARASVLRDGVPSGAFQLSCFAPPEALHVRADRLKRHSRVRFGRNRGVIEGHITKFYAGDA